MIDKILLVSKDKNVIDKLKSQKYESETTYTSVKEEFSYLNEFPKYKYDNLKIITKNNEVAIIGSLRKYMAKHSDRNILYYNPTISDFYDFCDKVESDLGIDISKMKVYQLEMGITAKVKNPVVDYLDSMFYLPNAKKNVFGDNSKRFNLSTKNEPYKASSFQFYDNAKLYNNNEENIIRMELAIPKRLKRKLKFNDAIIFEEFLYDNVWEDIYEQFIKFITAIKTKRIPTTIDNLLIGSPKELI